MRIGIPKEIKDQEYRVGATPAMVRMLVERGHVVSVQTGAGSQIGLTDAMYELAGGHIVETADDVYASEMVVKVKEPLETEYPLLREGLILFCFFHLAPARRLTEALIESKVIAIAYETVTDSAGRLPLLIPMSEIAGRIAIQVGAVSLQKTHGGKGVLLGGVPGVPPSRVAIVGGGIVGTESARMAIGLGANVTILDHSIERLRQLDHQFGSKLKTLFSTSVTLEDAVKRADLVIGSVLVPGKLAPKLITQELVKQMSPGSVIVDVAIDQGGCCETSRPTTHTHPTFVHDGIVHYCVTNMPGACAATSTIALTNATMGYALAIASKGFKKALRDDIHLRNGLNVCFGNVTNEAVAHDLNYPYIPAEEML